MLWLPFQRSTGRVNYESPIGIRLSRKQETMNSTPPAYNDLDTESLGEIIVNFIQWFFRGLVQPIYSLPFYRTGLKKGLSWAIIFLLFFAVMQTTVSAVRFGTVMAQAPEGFEDFPGAGELRSITIEDGIATVEGTQPLYFSEDRNFIGVDTTGEITEIDTRQFSDGILLTRTALHVLSNGDYQEYSLEDINATFGDPIVINKQVLDKFWNVFSKVILIVVVVASLLWNFLARLVFLAFLALIMWAIVQTWRKEVEYVDVLTTGIYVSVPVIYLNWALNQLGVYCFCIYTFIVLLTWALVLRLILPPTDTTSATPAMANSIQTRSEIDAIDNTDEV